jgi:alkylation response protein AidB-like acyl-CoA dehydrogenase
LTFVQLYFGALVAGPRPGLVYNTWPEIDGPLTPAPARLWFDEPRFRQQLAWCFERVEIMRMLGLRILTQYLRDGDLGPAASISKLYWSEYHQVAANLAMEIMGAAGLVPSGHVPPRAYRTDDPGAPNSTASWEHVWMLNAASGTVYAGTSQVQRNILGESILGLPKEPLTP